MNTLPIPPRHVYMTLFLPCVVCQSNGSIETTSGQTVSCRDCQGVAGRTTPQRVGLETLLSLLEAYSAERDALRKESQP